MGELGKSLIGLICHDKIIFNECLSLINAENNNNLIALIDITRGNINGNLS